MFRLYLMTPPNAITTFARGKLIYERVRPIYIYMLFKLDIVHFLLAQDKHCSKYTVLDNGSIISCIQI